MLVASADTAVDALAFRQGWLAHRSRPALYQVSVRSLAALIGRRLGGDSCLSSDFVGNDKPSVYAHLRGLLSHGRSPFRSCPHLILVPLGVTFGILPFQKGLVLVQGTCTPQVSRHARHTNRVHRRTRVERFGL